MNQPLRVLIVEDSTADADLLLHALRHGGYEATSAVVETPAAMRAALEGQDWDVITSDHAIPQFSAPVALALAKEVRPDVPFIIVSGDIDLNLAVSLMREGAQDYIPKGELARLVPAIERALRDVEVRRARQQVEDTLHVSEIRYRRLFEAARDGILILDAVTHQITDVNPFMVELLGYTRDEFLGKDSGTSACSWMRPPVGRRFAPCRRPALSGTRTCRSKPRRARAGTWSLSATSIWKTAIR
jgi:PAS domain-containing protein